MSTSNRQGQVEEQGILSDEELKSQVREVLYRNMVSGERAGFTYHFTKPSPETYPFQFFWDTCFHVYTLTALDEVDMAKEHVQSLFEMQLPDGFVGHMSYWKRLWPGRVTDLLQLRPRDVLRLYKPHMSALVQPPLAAQAVLRIYKHDHELSFVREMLPKLKKFYLWLAENRDFEGEGLLSIISPFESGMDWKPSYDPVLGYDKGKAGPLLFLKVLQVDAHNFLKGYDLPRIYRSNRFIVKDAAFNTIYAQNLEALAYLCQLVQDDDWQQFRKLGKKTEESIVRYMYDEKDAAFYDLEGHHFSKLRICTATIFFPLVLQSVSKEICKQVLERHLLQKDGFHVPYPVPSLSVNEPAFNPDESLYIWRGPTWVVFNWFLHEYLLEKGHEQEARELLLSVKRLISKSGFREYYDPFTGEGHGAEEFTWSGLVVDMINRQQDELYE
ncbi:trehalase family glycosidase [uncultured Pontibacter sp.]|uniref:amylo-alpha-1,6-glucosidase n=1 Tax=uncultured Pontibacter sp. TaxID=453356 RepID=UPI00260294AE|nr:trehalase family glycosidase [uncultured Pontibacter sp.]